MIFILAWVLYIFIYSDVNYRGVTLLDIMATFRKYLWYGCKVYMGNMGVEWGVGVR